MTGADLDKMFEVCLDVQPDLKPTGRKEMHEMMVSEKITLKDLGEVLMDVPRVRRGKLTPQNVADIYLSRNSMEEDAKRHGVSITSVKRIHDQTSWKRVTQQIDDLRSKR
jgi:hypothetical protein